MPLRQRNDSERCGRCGRKLREGPWDRYLRRRRIIGHEPGCPRRGLPMYSATNPGPLEGET